MENNKNESIERRFIDVLFLIFKSIIGFTKLSIFLAISFFAGLVFIPDKMLNAINIICEILGG